MRPSLSFEIRKERIRSYRHEISILLTFLPKHPFATAGSEICCRELSPTRTKNPSITAENSYTKIAQVTQGPFPAPTSGKTHKEEATPTPQPSRNCGGSQLNNPNASVM
jgi:hypothetical protein